jgi:hypothetical protein
MTQNTNPVLDAFREAFDSYDPWGSALSAHFDIAECLYRHGVPVPSEWEFSPGLAAQQELGEDASMFAIDCDLFMSSGYVSNLIHAGNVLQRYKAQCVLAGKDY